jgi:hypothetical protein
MRCRPLTSALGAIAALVLMRFTDRMGPGAITACSGLAVPVLLVVGLGFYRTTSSFTSTWRLPC